VKTFYFTRLMKITSGGGVYVLAANEKEAIFHIRKHYPLRTKNLSDDAISALLDSEPAKK